MFFCRSSVYPFSNSFLDFYLFSWNSIFSPFKFWISRHLSRHQLISAGLTVSSVQFSTYSGFQVISFSLSDLLVVLHSGFLTFWFCGHLVLWSYHDLCFSGLLIFCFFFTQVRNLELFSGFRFSRHLYFDHLTFRSSKHPLN